MLPIIHILAYQSLRLFYILSNICLFRAIVFGKRIMTTHFYVLIGSFHGPEVCNYVGLYILSKPAKVFSNFGLYRDDVLILLIYENIRKDVFKIMTNIGPKITLSLRNKVINFLVVILRLSDVNFRPYSKPFFLINVINKTCDHPDYNKKNIYS